MTTQISSTDSARSPLSEGLAELATTIEPPRDLWPDIEAGINNPPKNHNRHWAIAAGLLVAVLLGWQLNTSLPKDALARSQLAFVELLHRQHQATRDSVLSQYQQLGGPDRAAAEASQAALAEIRQAQALLHQALQQQPKNAELLRMLHWLQRRELELIQQQYPPRWRNT